MKYRVARSFDGMSGRAGRAVVFTPPVSSESAVCKLVLR